MHYLTELDLDASETVAILDRASELKADRRAGVLRQDLAGRHVALYFEKPSVRTRVSFTVGVRELGGDVVELGGQNTKVGVGEDPADFAKVMGAYVHLLVARVFAQKTVATFAASAGIPVINALSDERHPCQALADALTIRERLGRIEGVRFVFVGEGNNVAASTGLLLAALGAEVIIAAPRNYGLPAAIWADIDRLQLKIFATESVAEAVKGAQVLYTDTWVSMGQEAEKTQREAIFAGYRIGLDTLAQAAPEAIVMHCLPAVRGQEIDAAVMYHPASALWQQAENRLHVQKALMLRLLGR